MPNERKGTSKRSRVSRSAGDRRITLVDQTGLRRNASSECNRLMARVEKARAEWQRFEFKDRPAFDRWMAATFGALLTRSRELGALLHEKETLMAQVEEEMYFTGASAHTAYRRVKQARERPAPGAAGHEGAPPPFESGDDFADAKAGAEPDEFEQELMFETFLRTFGGINPDRLDDASYEQMFRDFKEKLFGRKRGGPPPFGARSHAAKTPKQEDSRIKEIYRALVRRLHPDLRADGSAAVSSLWHEVQEAYAAGNLERLETLLALADVQSSKSGDHISLFQMRSVIAELETDLKALQKSLRKARKEDAWSFSPASAPAALQAKISRRLNADLASQEQRLAELNALLELWANPRGGRKTRSPHVAREQWDFVF